MDKLEWLGLFFVLFGIGFIIWNVAPIFKEASPTGNINYSIDGLYLKAKDSNDALNKAFKRDSMTCSEFSA